MRILDIGGQGAARRRIRELLREAGFRVDQARPERVPEISDDGYDLAIIAESLLDDDRDAFEEAIRSLAGSGTTTAIIFRDRSLHLRSWLDSLNDRSIYIHAGDAFHVARVIALALVYGRAQEGPVGQIPVPLADLIHA